MKGLIYRPLLLLTITLTSCMPWQQRTPCDPLSADAKAALAYGDPDITAEEVREARCLVFRHGGINGFAKEKTGEYTAYRVTPLAYAAAWGKVGLMKVLLAQGADMNAPTSDDSYVIGHTLLHWAAYRGRVAAVRELLARGANAKAKDEHDRAVLLDAMSFHSDFEDSDRCEIAKMLIAHGADPNVRTDWNTTPLHWASHHNAPESVAYLLSQGADPNIRDKNGYTPLRRLLLRGNNPSPEVIRLLKQHGAHP